jgi:hypothetical protein
MNIQRVSYQTNNNEFLRQSLPSQMQPQRVITGNPHIQNVQQRTSQRYDVVNQYPVGHNLPLPQPGNIQKTQQINGNQRILTQQQQ